MSALATVDSGSAGGISREREALDWYVEPEWAVDALFDAEKFEGLIYDPACGGGTIPTVANRRMFEAHGSDIVDRGCFFAPRKSWDYLERGSSIPRPDNIVCNPPFAHAEAFIRLGLRTVQRKACYLLRLSFLEGRKRRALFVTTPIARVHVFSARVSMPPGGQGIKAQGGAVAFAWFVWDTAHPVGQGPTINWLDATP